MIAARPTTKTIAIAICLFLAFASHSQQYSAGINIENPSPNAVLHLQGGNNGNIPQGLIIPQLTTQQRTGMTLGANEFGILVYDSDEEAFYYWHNGWNKLLNPDNLTGEVDWTELTNIPADLADGDDDTQLSDADITGLGYLKTETDPSVDPSVKDGVDWTELTGIPADFADGTDDGGILAVNTDGTTVLGDGNAVDLSVNVGTGANQIVQLNGTGQLPAVDGSLLTGITTGVGPGSITNLELAPDAVVGGNILDGAITDVDISDVDVSKVIGLGTAGTLDVGIGANQVVQLDGLGALPPVDGSNLTGVTATIGAGSITNTELALDAVQSTNIVDGTIVDADISDVAAGKVTGLGTAATLDVGVGANQIVQLDGGGALPAVDGSALTGVTATVGANSITATELAADAVTTTEIADGTIATIDVANLAITDAKINDVAVTKITGAPNLDTDATDDLALTTIPNAAGDISGDFSTGLTIDADAVTTTEIADGTIATIDVANLAITDAKINDVAVTKITGAPNLDTDATDDLALTTIPNAAGDISGDFSTGLTIDTDAVTTTEIADGTIATVDVANLAITDAKINDVAVTKITGAPNLDTDATDDLALTTIPNAAGDISGDFSTGLTIDADAVTTTEIADGTIATVDVANLAITDAKINDVAVTKITGAPNLDTDNTDDLIGTSIPNAAGDISGDFSTGLTIDTDAVTTTEIADGTIATVDVANLAITDAKINDVAVTKITGAPNLDTDATDDLALTTTPNAAGDISGDFSTGLVIDADAVGSAEITDGTIVNADVAAGAAIAGSKVNPDFGAQAITTTGTLNADGATTLNGNVGVGDAAGDVVTVAGTTTFIEDITLDDGANDVTLQLTTQTVGPSSLIIPDLAGAGGTLLTTANVGTIATQDANTVAITGGAIDGTTIGSTTPSTVSATNLTASGTVNLGTDAVESAEITDGTIVNVDVAAGAAIAGSKVNPDFGAQAITTTGTLNADGATTLNGNVGVGDGAADVVTVAGTTTFIEDITLDDGANDVTLQLTTQTVGPSSLIIPDLAGAGGTLLTTANVGTIATQDANTVAITGGAIDGTTIGSTTPSTVSATNLTASGTVNLGTDAVESAEITDGTIVNADVAAGAAIAGSKVNPDFGAQAITTTGTLNADGATTLNGNVGVGDGAADVVTVAGTTTFIEDITLDDGANDVTLQLTTQTVGPSSLIIPDLAGAGGTLLTTANVGTIATQDANTVAITGGAIDGTTIGSTTPSTVSATNLTASGTVNLGTDAVESAEITDGTIVNADVAAGAAIAGSKVNPDFGAQAITTTGTLNADGATTLNGNVGVGDAAGDVVTVAGTTTFIEDITLDDGANDVTLQLTTQTVGPSSLIIPDLAGAGGTLLTTANVGTIATQDANTVAITGGAIDGTTIGSTTPSTVSATNLTASGTVNLGTDAVESAEITDGTIVNADVAAGAAIAGSKVNPDFGAQAITTTGTLNADGATTLNGNVGVGDGAADVVTVAGTTTFIEDITLDDGANDVTLQLTTQTVGPSSLIIPDLAGAGGTLLTTANVGTIATQDANTVAITGGAIDGTTIGSTTPSTVSATNLTASGTVNLGTDAVESAEITDGTIVNADVAAGAAIAGSKVNPDFGAQAITTTGTLNADGATTLNGNVGVGDAAGDVVTVAGTTTFIEDITLDDGANDVTLQLTTQTVGPSSLIIPDLAGAGGTLLTTANVGTIATQDANTVAITGGAIDGTTIGSTTPSTVSATNLTASGTVNLGTDAVESAEITDGTIVNADVAAGAAIAGSKVNPDFGAQAITTTGTLNADGATTLNGNVGVGDAAGDVVTVAGTTTFIEDITLDDGANDVTLQLTTQTVGPSSLIIPDLAGAGGTLLTTANVGTIASQDANTVAITGGAIDGTTIGSTTPSTVSATNLTASGTVNLGTDAVESAEITDGTIVNADVAAGAAIAGSKVNPDFGAQAITTTGTLNADGATTLNGNVGVGDGAADVVTVAGTTTFIEDITLDDGANDVTLQLTTQTIGPGILVVPNLAGATETILTDANIGTIASQDANTVAITGGAIDGTTIGSTTPSTVSATNLTASGTVNLGTDAVESAEITDGTIVNVDVAAGAAIAGSKVNPDFGAQAITTTGTLNADGATTLNGNVGVGDGAADVVTVAGTTTFIEDITLDDGANDVTLQLTTQTIGPGILVVPNLAGATETILTDANIGTIASQDANTVAITGGAIDGTTIGSTTPSTVSATNLTASGTVNLGTDAVESAEITDGTIVNVDVAAGAAIAGSKVNPDFGAQAITTTGTLNADGATTLNGNVGVGDGAADVVTVAGTTTFIEDITLDDGANDVTLQLTTQTIGPGILVVPNLAGGTETIATLNDVLSFPITEVTGYAGIPSLSINNPDVTTGSSAASFTSNADVPVLQVTHTPISQPGLSSNTGIVIGDLTPDLAGAIRYTGTAFQANIGGGPGGWTDMTNINFPINEPNGYAGIATIDINNPDVTTGSFAASFTSNADVPVLQVTHTPITQPGLSSNTGIVIGDLTPDLAGAIRYTGTAFQANIGGGPGGWTDMTNINFPINEPNGYAGIATIDINNPDVTTGSFAASFTSNADVPVLQVTHTPITQPGLSSNTGIVIGDLTPDLAGAIRYTGTAFQANIGGGPGGWTDMTNINFPINEPNGYAGIATIDINNPDGTTGSFAASFTSNADVPVLQITHTPITQPGLSSNTGIVIGDLTPDLAGAIRYTGTAFQANIGGGPGGWTDMTNINFPINEPNGYAGIATIDINNPDVTTGSFAASFTSNADVPVLQVTHTPITQPGLSSNTGIVIGDLTPDLAGAIRYTGTAFQANIGGGPGGWIDLGFNIPFSATTGVVGPLFYLEQTNVSEITAEFINNDGTTLPALSVGNGVGGTGTVGGGIGFTGEDDLTNQQPAGVIRAEITNNANASFSGDLVFETTTAGGLNEHLRITEFGESIFQGPVGIQYTNPPLSMIQVGPSMGLSKFDNLTNTVDGDAIAVNLEVDRSNVVDNDLIRIDGTQGNLLFMDDGRFEFLRVAPGGAGTTVNLATDISTSFTLDELGDAKFDGDVVFAADINFDSDLDHFIDAGVSSTAGSNISFDAGDGAASFNGGNLNLSGGIGDAGGSATLNGGQGTNGNGGNVDINSGFGSAGFNHGNITIRPAYDGTAGDGNILMRGPTRIGHQNASVPGSIELEDAGGANAIQISADAASSAYSIILPPGQAAGALTNDGSGNLSWQTGGLTLPYSATQADAGSLFDITNSGNGVAASFANSFNQTAANFYTNSANATADFTNDGTGPAASFVNTANNTAVGIQGDITFLDGFSRSIGVQTPAGAGPGDDFTIYTGDAVGAGPDNGGSITIRAGDGVGTGGNGGQIFLDPGIGPGGVDGNVVSNTTFVIKGANPITLENGTGTQAVGFRAAPAGTNSVIWELPDGDGAPGEVLSTNGAGILSWVASGSLTLPYTQSQADAGDLFSVENTGAGAAAFFGNSSDAVAVGIQGNLEFVDGADRTISVAQAAVGFGNSIELQGGDAAGASGQDGGDIVFSPGFGDGVGLDGTIVMQAETYITPTTPTGTSFAAAISANNVPTDYSQIMVAKARNSIGAENPVALGDELGAFSFSGWDGTNYELGASIRATALDNFTGAVRGTSISFDITPPGSPSTETRAVMDEGGLTIFENSGVSTAFTIQSAGTGFGTSITTPGGQGSNLLFQLPPNAGAAGNVLSTDGAGILSWVAPSGFTIPTFDDAVNVIFGSTAPGVFNATSPEVQLGVVSGGNSRALLTASSYGGSSELVLSRANGTQGGETQLGISEVMGEISFIGHDNLGYAPGGSIIAQSTEAWSTGSNRGTALSFRATPTATGADVEMMRLEDNLLSVNGSISAVDPGPISTGQFVNSNNIGVPSLLVGNDFGGTGTSGGAVEFQARNTGASQQGVGSIFTTVSNDVSATFAGDMVFETSSAGALSERMRLNSAGNALFTGDIDVGASSVIIDNAGDVQASNNVTAGNIVSASASVNVSGTTTVIRGAGDSYFGGNVGIGITTPGATLDVNGTANVATTLTLSGNMVSVVDGPFNIDPVASDRRIVLLDGGPITEIVAGTNGQEIILISTAGGITIVDVDNAGTNIQLANNNPTFVMNVNATLHLVYYGTDWIEIGRSAQP